MVRFFGLTLPCSHHWVDVGHGGISVAREPFEGSFGPILEQIREQEEAQPQFPLYSANGEACERPDRPSELSSSLTRNVRDDSDPFTMHIF